MTEVLLARLDDITAAAAGAIATASNVGTVGTGVFKQKTGTDAEFYKINPASTKVSFALVGTDRIDVDVVEANLSIANQGGVLAFTRISPVATDRLLGRDTAGAGAAEEIAATGGIEFTGAGAIQRSALTGDVTASAGSGATTIPNNTVTNAKMADMVQATIKGRQAAAGTGDPEDLTATQARTAMGLGTAAVENIGTSGATVPLLNSSTLTFGGALGIGGAPASQAQLTVTTLSARFYGSDSAFTAGGNCAMVDFAGGYARVGGINGGGGNVGLQLISRNGVVAQADAGWQFGTPTGGDKGAGTINVASGIYNNGTLLSTGFTEGTEQASTSGTSIDFTSIPAGTKVIVVEFDGVSTNGSSQIMIQLGDSGGVEATGYLGSSWSSGGGAANFTTGFGIRCSNAATAVVHGALTLTREDSANNTWVISGCIADPTNTNMGITAGVKPLSATLDRVRVTTVNGTDTFDAGAINIKYAS